MAHAARTIKIVVDVMQSHPLRRKFSATEEDAHITSSSEGLLSTQKYYSHYYYQNPERKSSPLIICQ